MTPPPHTPLGEVGNMRSWPIGEVVERKGGRGGEGEERQLGGGPAWLWGGEWTLWSLAHGHFQKLAPMHWAPSFLPLHSILSSPFRGHFCSPATRFGGFLCTGTFSVILVISIDQRGPKFHCVKQLYTPATLRTVDSPHHCHHCNHKNINCRSHWRSQGRIKRETPTPGHVWMWQKIVLIFPVKICYKLKTSENVHVTCTSSDF